MKENVIFTDKTYCQDCYKCIKECPVKSIKMDSDGASVLFDTCIYCGTCVKICPTGAKRYREDVSKVKYWIETGEKIVACLAPAFVSDFTYLSTEDFVKTLYKLGFAAVSEVAIGADIVARETSSWLNEQKDGVYMSSCCPAVVNYINIYQPELLPNLVPVVSPMVAHARLLRKTLSKNYKLVFVGPCIAKKDERDYNSEFIDAAITFENLKMWFDEMQCSQYPFDKIELPQDFVIGRPGLGDMFPVDGGMLSTMCEDMKVTECDYMAFSGMEQVIDICGEFPKWNLKGKIFLELMACKGGCVKGPAMINHSGIVAKRRSLLQMHSNLQKSEIPYVKLEETGDINYINQEFKRDCRISCSYSEADIVEALHSIGKWSLSDEYNCTGCGYDSCRAFAEALLDGKVHREMCVSCMRKEAQDKASVLLQRIPYGVVTVDDRLKVVEANHNFAKIMGSEIEQIYEEIPTLKGLDIKAVLPFYSLFESLLTSGGDISEHDVRDGENFYHVSIVSIQQYKLVCGIIQNLRDPEMQYELMTDRIKEVIKQNVESVQRIAYLLGENAAFTESMLNSLVESQKGANLQKEVRDGE